VLTHSVCRILLNNREVDREIDCKKNNFFKVVDVLSVLIRAQTVTVVTASYFYILIYQVTQKSIFLENNELQFRSDRLQTILYFYKNKNVDIHSDEIRIA